ncbi:MAG: DJ-1/PfpI family protein [Clostridiales bacterium]|nr:DJ-1/PfpI family protein [Clostridiales bacterium]
MIIMFLADGFEEGEAIVPLDILRRAGADIKTVGVGRQRDSKAPVRGSHGIDVTPDLCEDEIPDGMTEMVILPGGKVGSDNLYASAVVRDTLLAVNESGGCLAAICAAPYILGEYGYLEGKRAVCYPGFESRLKGAVISDAQVVTDGNVITAEGMGAAHEFGLALVAKLYGKERADKIASEIRYR